MKRAARLLMAWTLTWAWALPARAQAVEGVLAGSEGKRPAIITLADSKLLTRLLLENQGPSGALLRAVGANAKTYQLQVIFTQVNRDKKGRPLLRHHSYGLDTSRYFYTASLVKLPTAALTLEWLRQRGWSPHDVTLHLGAANDCQAADSAAYRPLSMAELITRSFVVSDNPAYNRLFELLGPTYLNSELTRRGYGSARIRHRYNSACWNDPLGGGHLNPVSLRLRDREIYAQPARAETVWAPHPLTNLTPTGADFSRGNFVNLIDLHRVMLALYVPTALDESQRFGLKPDDYRLLHRAMATLPTEVDSPWFDTAYYTAARMKYLAVGTNPDTLMALRRDSVLILNKVGLAYGYLTDCAYVIDFKRGREFFISAVIYVNADGVIGDDKYEYDTVGQPFLQALGRACLDHERERRVPRRPKLQFLRQAWSDRPSRETSSAAR